MANGLSKSWWPASRGGDRLGLVCAVLAAMVASVGAQEVPKPIAVAKSALFSVPPGHSLVATVVETGSSASVSEVRIEFRDAADKRRGFAVGQLTRGRTARLLVQIPASARLQQLRAVVRITSLTDGEGSQPIVGLEDLDADSLIIETKPPCSPPLFGSGAEGNCGGWRVTHFTLGQGGPPDSADIP